MSQSTESRLIIGVLLLGAAALSGCEGDSRPFQEAAEIQALGLTGVSVVPPATEISGNVVINRGQSLQMTLTGQSGTDDNVPVSSTERTWTSSDTDVVTVSDSGLITGGNNGDAVVSVSIGGIQAALPVTVFDAALLSIESINGPSSIELCLPEEYFAIGLFEGGTERTLYNATYSLNDDAISTLSPGDDSVARVNATSLESLTLTARADGLEFPADLTVLNTLTAIGISPETVSIEVGELLNLSATGTYSDNPAQPAEGDADGTLPDRLPETITANVEWRISEGADNANVNNAGENKGRLRGVAEGTATVQASCGLDVVDTQLVTVNAAVAIESDELSFEIDDIPLEGGAIRIGLNESRVLRVSRGESFDDDNLITNNLDFSAATNGISEPLIDETALDDFRIEPLPGAVGTTTIITIELRDDNGGLEASGTITVTVTI